MPYCYLDGQHPQPGRRCCSASRTAPVPVFLISLKAGGFGLNLTEADYCFLLDPWWNPATEAQAVDRTHRIGQTRNVMVYRLIAKDTIEEKVMALQGPQGRAVRQRHRRRRAVQHRITADDIRGLFALTGRARAAQRRLAQAMQVAAAGRAASRAGPIGPPQRSQVP